MARSSSASRPRPVAAVKPDCDQEASLWLVELIGFLQKAVDDCDTLSDADCPQKVLRKSQLTGLNQTLYNAIQIAILSMNPPATFRTPCC